MITYKEADLVNWMLENKEVETHFLSPNTASRVYRESGLRCLMFEFFHAKNPEVVSVSCTGKLGRNKDDKVVAELVGLPFELMDVYAATLLQSVGELLTRMVECGILTAEEVQ